VASDFVKALTNTFVNLLLAFVNIQQPTFALAANNQLQLHADMRGIQKVLSLNILNKNFYWLYIGISVRCSHKYLVYSCKHILEVTLL